MAINDFDDTHPNFGKVPRSKGLPTPVQIGAMIGIIVIFAIGAAVILSSSFGHEWPSLSTLRTHL